MSHVSHHARKRIKERIGISEKAADRQATLALERGFTHKQLKGRLYKWATGIILKYEHHPTVRLYNMKLFFF